MLTDRPRAGCFLEGAPPLRHQSTLVLATGFAVLALAATGPLNAARAQTDPAPTTATPSTTPAHAHHKSMHHKPMYPKDKHGHLMPTAKGNAAVEDLNSQSLNAAKAGTTFTPTASSTSAESGMSNAKMAHGMHHHHGKGMMPAGSGSSSTGSSGAMAPAGGSTMPSTSAPASPPAETAPGTPPASTAPGGTPPQ